MSWTGFGRTLRTVGVVGSGQIGPDIALHFAKSLAPAGVRVVVQDIAPAAIESGRAKLRKKVEKGAETGAFKPDLAKAMIDAVLFTTDLAPLRGADLVVEAASEDLFIKRKIFADLSERCPEAILTSNSSHLEPEVIFDGAKRPGRTLVTHYFFPAERNLLVEVVPGQDTDATVTDFCMKFYEAVGKIPIRVGSRYGYAIDPIFEGLFLAALLLAEQGAASHKQIDFVAQKALGLGVGPFTAMNLTGGTALTRVGLEHYHERIMPWFRVPPSLKDRTDPWPAAGRDEKVEVDPATFEKVARRLQAVYFGLVGEILDAGITNVADLELGVETALVMNAPFRMMNSLGTKEALRLVEEFAAANGGFKVAACLRVPEPFAIPCVLRRDAGDVAVVTIRRPKTLNALDRDVYHQLRRTFEEIAKDPKVVAAVLTGFGTKAFVSGADIQMLAAVKSPEEGAALSWESQTAVMAVENCGKPVVCALNGLALGGGSELAMACTVRIAKAGLPVCFGQPEPKLGIIPGSGGTQRLPRIVGFERAWEILRTGRTVSAEEAEKLGYISDQVEGDIVEAAIDIARHLKTPSTIERGPLRVPEKLPAIEIAPLSRKVDEILRRAILEGCARDLDAGLWFESRCFGEACGTKDMRIGLENFFRTQLRSPAPFVHA
ncbi:MAG: enoyl-CoA hydratase/isomerase family protein [Planctomycetes bacterium]|nr:enoyl-CoA hydratase/isomerase family protein [Planctomycetota bacterium]